VTDVVGDPLMRGALLPEPAARTVIAKAGSAAVLLPSLTLITIFENVPTWLLVGVPESWPVEVLNDAQDGRLLIVKPSLLPSGSEAVGRKL
jgi:hypothetical protein